MIDLQNLNNNEMKKEQILTKLNSVLLCMSAHPDNEPDSEFADRISDLEEIIESWHANQSQWIKTSDNPPIDKQIILGWRIAEDTGWIVPMEWNIHCDTAEEYPFYMPYPEPPKQQ
jgi:hypothetical protein